MSWKRIIESFLESLQQCFASDTHAPQMKVVIVSFVVDYNDCFFPSAVPAFFAKVADGENGVWNPWTKQDVEWPKQVVILGAPNWWTIKGRWEKVPHSYHDLAKLLSTQSLGS